jgi:hypothetical protein
MNAGTVSRLLSLIPERAARTQSGCVFYPEASASPHPERVALLGKFLSWLSPLESLSKDDQRALGLTAGQGKPAQEAAGDEEGEDHELESEPDTELDSEADTDADTEVDSEPLDEWEPEPAATPPAAMPAL